MKKQFIINTVAFIIGAATGSIIAYKFLEKKFEHILESEVEAVKNYAKQKIKNVKENIVFPYDDNIDNNIDDVDIYTISAHSNIRLSDLDTDQEIIVDGDGIYHENTVYFQDEDFEEEEDHGFGMPDPPTHAERMKIPFIISPREFSEEMQHFNKVALSYYSGDRTFADDQDELIDDIRLLVGDAYEYFGCNPEDPDIVHVRNYKLGTDFELCRVYGRYSDTVAGHYRTANQEG